MGPLVTIALVVALSGALLRWLRVPGPLVVLAQVVIVGAVVSLYICGSPLPIGEAWLRMELAFQDASATAQQYAAPVPRGVPPIDPLLIAGGAACMLLVDIVVGTLRRVPLAGLPLLTIYSIPVSLLGGGVSWIVFTLTTIGFLLMLYLQESRQIARWGRPLGRRPASTRAGSGSATAPCAPRPGAIGAAATALAIVVPIFIPTLRPRRCSTTGSARAAATRSRSRTRWPTSGATSTRGADVDMIQVTTDDPDPAYLRISVLNRFSDNEWSSGDRTAPTDQRAMGDMPAITGLDPSVPTRSYDYDVADHRRLPLDVAADAGAHLPHRRRGRLALRLLDDGLHGLRRRPEHPGHDLLDDRGRPRARSPGAGRRQRRPPTDRRPATELPPGLPVGDPLSSPPR